MRYLDHACAWGILITGFVFMVVVAIWHPPGTELQDSIMWILAATINFLRLRNDYAAVRGLRSACISANILVLTLELLRFGLYGGRVFSTGGPSSLIVAIALVAETVFSVTQSGSSVSME